MNNDFEYHNVVDVFVFNHNGQIALQKRSFDDKSFPGHWDFSAGGHVDPGETVDLAAKREVFEEIGLKATPTFVSKIQLKYEAWNSQIIRLVDVHIYKIKSDGNFIINESEVENIEFFELKDIQKMIDDGQKFHPEFLLIWNNDDLMKLVGEI